MVALKKNTFNKNERLCSKKAIENLFANGKPLFVHPLKVLYIKKTAPGSQYPVRVMFVVPKRNCKKAHDRNRIKRLMRESYRLQKNEFYSCCNTAENQVDIAFIYTAKTEANFKDIFSKTGKLLKQITEITLP